MSGNTSPSIHEVRVIPDDEQQRPKWLHEVLTAVVSGLHLKGGKLREDGQIVGQFYSFPDDDPAWLGAAEHQLKDAFKWSVAPIKSRVAKDLSNRVSKATKKPLRSTLAYCLHRVQCGAAHEGAGVLPKAVVADLRRASSKAGDLADQLREFVEPSEASGGETVHKQSESLDGYMSADELHLKHGIRRPRLSEGKKNGDIEWKNAPSDRVDLQGRAVRILYCEADAKKHAAPKRNRRKPR